MVRFRRPVAAVPILCPPPGCLRGCLGRSVDLSGAIARLGGGRGVGAPTDVGGGEGLS